MFVLIHIILLYCYFFFEVRGMMINRSCFILDIGLTHIGCFVYNLLSYSKTSYCNRGKNNKHTTKSREKIFVAR